MKYFCEFLRNTRLHETRAFFGLWCTISQKSHLQSLHTLDQALLRISAQHTIACNTHCMQQWSSRYNFSKDPSIVILYSRSSPFANLRATRTCMQHAPFVVLMHNFSKLPCTVTLHRRRSTFQNFRRRDYVEQYVEQAACGCSCSAGYDFSKDLYAQ